MGRSGDVRDADRPQVTYSHAKRDYSQKRNYNNREGGGYNNREGSGYNNKEGGGYFNRDGNDGGDGGGYRRYQSHD